MSVRALLRLLPFALLVAGCGGTRPTADAPPVSKVTELHRQLDALLGGDPADSLFVPAEAHVKIVSLATGETLYERGAMQLVRPASNMKLLTTAAALVMLGPRFEVTTDVLADSVRPDGTILGNLYLVGHGDALLQPTDLTQLAAAVRNLGFQSDGKTMLPVTKITGDVIADASYFDPITYGPGWMWDDEPEPTEARISALSLGSNLATVVVTPGAQSGAPATVTIEPATAYVTLDGRATTLDGGATSTLVVNRRWQERLNTVEIGGGIPAGSTAHRERITVGDPAVYAATVLREALVRAGTSVAGTVRAGTAPRRARHLVRTVRTLDSIVIRTNKVSDNLGAESLRKMIAAEKTGQPGDWPAGRKLVEAFVRDSLGIDPRTIELTDGSGVSHYNLVTADLFIRLLRYMHGRPDLWPTYRESLPVAGVDGSLSGRMKGTAAAGNLRAKTGTISGVTSLSGVVTTRDGEDLAFSIQMQNHPYRWGTRTYTLRQDAVGALLAGWSRR